MEDPKSHNGGASSSQNGQDNAVKAFPRSQEDFENDPRVSFSKLEEKWLLEAEDGSDWEFVEATSKWVSLVDADLMKQQMKAYAVPGVDENEPVVPSSRKRKQDGETSERPGKRPAQSSQPKNTAIYVTGLPEDTDIDEVKHVFSRCGMIAEEIDNEGVPRIKLYKDSNGVLKGDALIVFFRPESVPLALTLLDDAQFRPGSGKNMRITQADYSYKKQKEPVTEGEAGAQDKKKQRQKQKIINKTQKLNSKLADWDDDDPQSLPTRLPSKWDKVVILKHMFTLKEIEEDPAAILDIKEDIRDECTKLGEVTNVVLYDKEAEGVVTVRFRDPDAAGACATKMHGRSFGGQAVVATIATGSERFQKSKQKTADDDDDDTETRALDEFGDWLEGN